MSKYDADEPTFVQKATRAVGDGLMRDIVADSHRPSPVNPWPRPEGGGAPKPQVEPPTYVEWARQRLGVEWTEDRARNYYLTRKTAGEDVGLAVASSEVGVPRKGWVDPPKVADWRPPGIAVIDRLVDQQDAIDRRDRERLLGKVRR